MLIINLIFIDDEIKNTLWNIYVFVIISSF